MVDIEETAGSMGDTIQVDIAEAPEALFSSDAPKQGETLLEYDETEDDEQLQESIRRFSDAKVIDRSLEDMEHYYAREQRGTCLNLLTKRVKVDWRRSDYVSRANIWGERFVIMLKINRNGY